MKREIRVERQSDGKYLVTVAEGGSHTAHAVSVEEACRNQLAGPQGSAEDLLRKSFEFLLEREPKESILRSFDLRVIQQYFPEYEREIRRRLGR